MTSLGMITLVVLLVAIVYSKATVFPRPSADENNPNYWLKMGTEEIEAALLKPKLTNIAKNVILFMGDGMGITVNTVSRIYKSQKKNGYSGEEGHLVWEKFPNIALLKTYDLDKQVSDSASTGAAYLCGVKANYYTVGVNGHVKFNDCEASLIEENRLTSILQWAQEAKKDTGFITTTQVTHASVAAAYAKSANRKWQCDRKMKKFGQGAAACKDIARQLVEDVPGKHFKVVMGGGRQEMGSPKRDEIEDKCKRTDGRNLVRDWISQKEENGKSYAYVTTTRELHSVDTNNTEYILGLFDEIHMPYEIDRDTSLDGCPHIKEMVEVAINRLKKSDNGFFLFVEGGMIDNALHITSPKRALEEVLAFEEAVELAMTMVNTEETLVVVTADHSHVMTMNGYPPRGNDILGIVTESEDISDGLPFTTLTFANGHGFNYSFNGKEVVRPNLTGVDTTDKDYVPLAGMPTHYDYETHGGEDVAAFAVGPWAHLFHRVHEQTHVAYVMAYASCTGPYKDCHHHAERPFNEQVKKNPKSDSSSATGLFSGIIFIFIVAVQILFG